MTRKVEFQPPPGAVPEGTAVGDDFDLVCTFRVKKNGTCCLTVMGDQKMPGYDDAAATHDNYASEANSIAAAGQEGY